MSDLEITRNIIPFGNCIPDETGSTTPVLEAFNAVDRGSTESALVATAVGACLDCRQLLNCKNQQDEIGNELWRQGVRNPVVGAELLTHDGGPSTAADMDLPAFRFDLSRLPADPARRLDQLRQGVRSGQLSTISPFPVGAKTIAGNYHSLLAQRQPELVRSIDAVLSPDDKTRAFKNIVLVLCQQADFANFSQRTKSVKPGAQNKRYDPETHDYESNYATVQLYLEQTVAIKRMGYRQPGRMGIYYSEDYSRRLLDQFGNVAKPSIFFQIIRDNMHEPYRAMTAFAARLHAQRSGTAGGPENVLRRRALMGKDPAGSSDEQRTLGRLAAAHPNVSKKVLARAMLEQSNPSDALEDLESRIAAATRYYGADHAIATPEVIARFARKSRKYMEDLDTYIQNVGALYGLYGENPDFTPGIINRFASQYGSKCMKAASDFVDRLKTWRGWSATDLAKDYPVPDSFLVEYALAGDVHSYQDIAKAHALKTMQSRFRARNSRRSESTKVPVSTWMFHRILNLYPLSEASEVADNLFVMMGEGILVDAVSELQDLQDQAIELNVDGISDPRTRRYLTFSGILGHLSSKQRMSIAYDFNLARLIYGQAFTEDQLRNMLHITKVHGYSYDNALPQCYSLIKRNGNGWPISFATIKQDVIDLLHANPAETADWGSDLKDLPNRRMIIGAKAMQFAQEETILERSGLNISKAQRTRLVQLINTLYPPNPVHVQQQAAFAVESAILGARLSMRDVTGNEAKPALSDDFYEVGIDEADRALAAHVMGLDRLLYGKDLGLTLRYRLNTSDLESYFYMNVLPKMKAWQRPDEAMQIMRCTPYALRNIFAPHLAKCFFWFAGDRVIAISTQAVADIQSRPFPDAVDPGWMSQSELAVMAADNNKDIAAILKRVPPVPESRKLIRPHQTGLLDVYFSPVTSGLIASLAAA